MERVLCAASGGAVGHASSSLSPTGLHGVQGRLLQMPLLFHGPEVVGGGSCRGNSPLGFLLETGHRSSLRREGTPQE